MNRKTKQTGFLFLTGNHFFFASSDIISLQESNDEFYKEEKFCNFDGKKLVNQKARQGRHPVISRKQSIVKVLVKKKKNEKVFLHFLSLSMIYLLQIYYFKVRRHFSTKLTRRFKICIAFFVVFQYFKVTLTSTDFILLLKDNNAHRL